MMRRQFIYRNSLLFLAATLSILVVSSTDSYAAAVTTVFEGATEGFLLVLVVPKKKGLMLVRQ